MSKSDLITALAVMNDTDPRLAELEAILKGAQRAGTNANAEPWLSLKEVSQQVRRHVVWLHRLRVPQVCGERLAGRRSYKRSTVEEYLKSSACMARLAELRELRREHCKPAVTAEATA